MDGMSAAQFSAMLGQWVGAAICLGALALSVKGLHVEYKEHANRGLRLITLGSVVGMLGCLIFAIATKLVGF